MADNSLVSALIGVTGALAAGVILFASNRYVANKNLKKEISLKIAEYRIQWMNNLTDEFSKFMSTVFVILLSADKPDEVVALSKDVFYSSSKIKLLMNSEDDHYKELIFIMESILNTAAEYTESSNQNQKNITKKLEKLEEDFLAVCNKILKNEWRKTKQNLREDVVEVSALRSKTVDGYLYRRRIAQ